MASQPGHVFQGWLVAERRSRARCSHSTQPVLGGRDPAPRALGPAEVSPQCHRGASPSLALSFSSSEPPGTQHHPGVATWARPSGEASQSSPAPAQLPSLSCSTFKQFSAFPSPAVARSARQAVGNQEFKRFSLPPCVSFGKKNQPNTNKPKPDVAWAL